MNVLIATILFGIAYFIYHYVLKMYYRYYYYMKQGIPSVGFPLPVIGTQHKFVKACMELDKYSRFPHVEYWHKYCGKKLPKMLLDFRTPNGALVVNDPRIVNELYVTKNKYFDRHYREKQVG
jgi:hypothetical protein